MKTESLILGIDDSGRGPVIGPMVLAGCLIDKKTEADFKKLGVKDSKQLTALKREHLAEIIKQKSIAFHIVLVHPTEIDGRNHVGLNLNKIEAIKSAEIINNLNKKSEKIKVIIDCPSNNIKKWQDYLERHIDNKENLDIRCEHKADVNHVACSAASILAKTTRDAEIEKIKQSVGKDFGSGYPSDPITKKFLQDYYKKYKHDGIFRETWGTIANHKKKKEQRNLGDF